MKIGCVEYINALPLILPFKMKKIPFDAEWVFSIPTHLNSLLRENKLDIALTSSVEYFEGAHQLAHGFCIAAEKEIMSVNLYYKKPLEKAKIALTHHSATSVSLLNILCRHFWKFEPQFVSLDRSRPLDSYDAFLLIGDEALEKRTFPGYHTVDLAKEWIEKTDLPFVFAVFSARKGLSKESLLLFEKKLEASFQWGEKNFDFLVQNAHEKSALPKNLIERYFHTCRYRLGKKEIKGLEKFKELHLNVRR